MINKNTAFRFTSSRSHSDPEGIASRIWATFSPWKKRKKKCGANVNSTHVLWMVWNSCWPSTDTPALIAYACDSLSSFSARALLASWRRRKDERRSDLHFTCMLDSAANTCQCSERTSRESLPYWNWETLKGAESRCARWWCPLWTRRLN